MRTSRLGLGGAQFGNLYQEMTDLTAAQTFAAAWEHGVRYFDTAPHYGLGLSERRLGALLSDRPRESYVLSTKVGRLLVPNPGFAGVRDNEGFDVPAHATRVWDFSRDGVRRSIEESLDRLGLDRVDIALLHDPEDHWRQATDEGLLALKELRDEGMVAAIGAGMNDARHLAELIREHDVDVVMCAGRYTLLEQANEMMAAAVDHGVAVVIAGVYNSGLLARERPDRNATYNYAPASPELIAHANAIADICEQYGVSLPHAALAFPLRHPAVVSVVVGAATPGQVNEAAQRLQEPVPEELWEALLEAGLTTGRER
jgi:D-threo-aldose 1-dehydrogenase